MHAGTKAGTCRASLPWPATEDHETATGKRLGARRAALSCPLAAQWDGHRTALHGPAHRTRVRAARAVRGRRRASGGQATSREALELVAQLPHTHTRDCAPCRADPTRHRPSRHRSRTGMGTGPTVLHVPVASTSTRDVRTPRSDLNGPAQ